MTPQKTETLPTDEVLEVEERLSELRRERVRLPAAAREAAAAGDRAQVGALRRRGQELVDEQFVLMQRADILAIERWRRTIAEAEKDIPQLEKALDAATAAFGEATDPRAGKRAVEAAGAALTRAQKKRDVGLAGVQDRRRSIERLVAEQTKDILTGRSLTA